MLRRVSAHRGILLLAFLVAAGCGPDIVKPRADAGEDFTTLQGEPTQLDGTGSRDGKGRRLHFEWRFKEVPAGSFVAFNDPTLESPWFTPDEPGEYVVGLVVVVEENGGARRSREDSVTVTASSCEPAGVATSPAELTAEKEIVTLVDDSTSPCDRTLSRTWSVLSTPPGSLAILSNPVSGTPAFAADVPGSYRFRVTPADERGIVGEPAEIEITAAAREIDAGDPGYHVSVALLGTAGSPVIAYHEASDADLKVARLAGTAWQREVVESQGDVGAFASIAIEPQAGFEGVRIAYQDRTNARLRYAERTASGWALVTVDDTSVDDGAHASLALDPATGAPRIVYQAMLVDRTILKYAWCDAADCTSAANWNRVPLVDRGVSTVVGAGASLALTSTGLPRFTFQDVTDGSLAYGACTTAVCATVTTRTVDDGSADVGSQSALALTGSDRPRIAYYDATNTTARYASCEDADCTLPGAGWTTTAIDTAADAGSAPTLSIADDGTPIATWVRAGAVRLGRFDGVGWTIVDLAPSGASGDARSAAAAVTSSGAPRLAYQRTDGKLYFFQRGR